MFNKKQDNNSAAAKLAFSKSAAARAKMSPEIPKTSFRVYDLNISRDRARAGDTVSISCTVKNEGDIIGEYQVNLKVNDKVVEHQAAIIFGGKIRVVNFNRTFADPGKYSVEIDDLTENLSILPRKERPAAAPKPSKAVPGKIELSDLKIEPSTMKAGETATVSCLLTNNGQNDQQYKAELKINNQVVGTQNIFLKPKQQQRVVFSGSIEDLGEHSIAIGDLKGNLVVNE